jgi:ABC-type multidrug transport system ATPase subunit
VILLTTHHLEEAEMLSDYVIILSRGKTIETGTLRQLKTKFSIGNQLKLTLKNPEDPNSVVLNVQNQKQRLLNSVSEQTRRTLETVVFEQYDSFSILAKTGNLSNEQMEGVLSEIYEKVSDEFYVTINSCTFDDVFREIDRVYQTEDHEQKQKKTKMMFRNFISYINGRERKSF